MLKRLYKQKGWKVTDIIFDDDRFVVNIALDQRCKHYCPKCHKRLQNHSNEEHYVKDIPLIGTPVVLHIHTMQKRCPNCDTCHTIRMPNCHPTRGCTWRLMRLVSFLCRVVNLRTVSELTLVSPPTASRIDKEMLRKVLPKPFLDGLDFIIVDEKYLGKSAGFVTCVLNGRTGEPIYIAKGKDGACLDGFYNMLTESQRAGIKYIAVDRSNAYLAWAKKCFPNIIVCFDAFHLIANMNEVLDKVRREEMKNPDYTFGKFMKGKRFLILCGQENLDEDGLNSLNLLRALNQRLYTAYLLKEEFRSVLKSKSENEAIWRLTQWIKKCMACGIKQIERFAKGICEKFNEVINGVRYGLNSARIEAMNAEIKRIQSKACGFFDEEYLLLKLRQSYLHRRGRLVWKPYPLRQWK